LPWNPVQMDDWTLQLALEAPYRNEQVVHCAQRHS
jgi:hypothetical protein